MQSIKFVLFCHVNIFMYNFSQIPYLTDFSKTLLRIDIIMIMIMLSEKKHERLIGIRVSYIGWTSPSLRLGV